MGGATSFLNMQRKIDVVPKTELRYVIRTDVRYSSIKPGQEYSRKPLIAQKSQLQSPIHIEEAAVQRINVNQ